MRRGRHRRQPHGTGRIYQGSFCASSRLLEYADKVHNVGVRCGTGHRVDTMKIWADAAAFSRAFAMARGELGTDEFFGIRSGTGEDGVPRWPSLQYARYLLEMEIVHGALYEQARLYAEETGQAFAVYVPAHAPFFPSAGYDARGVPGIVAISGRGTLADGSPDPAYDQDFASKVFTARFASGETW